MPNATIGYLLPPDGIEAQWTEFIAQAREDRSIPFDQHWAEFQRIFGERNPSAGPLPAWRPKKEEIPASNLGRMMSDLGIDNYADLHAWSVENRPAFWQYVVDKLGIIFARPPNHILDLTNGVSNPRWLPGAEMNIVDSCFQAPADKTAILSCKEGTSALTITTYGQLEALANRFANGLGESGIERGDAIGIYMPMTMPCVAAYLGIVRAGCRVVSIADSFSPDEVKTRMEIAGSKVILTVYQYIRAGRNVRLYDKVKEAGIERAIVIAAEEGEKLRQNDTRWDEFLATEDSFTSVTGDPYEPSNILFSSGTTGTPKAIPWTHLTPLKCAMDGHFHGDIRPDDIAAWPTNIGWMMGPWLIYATLLNSAAMALYEGAPLGPDFTRFVEKAGVSFLGVVPSLVRTWRAAGARQGVDLTGIRLFGSTGEPSNREDYLWLMSRTGYRAPVIEYLGGTEIGGGHITGTIVQPASPATFTTPALGLDFLILDEDGQPVDEGEMGELYLIPPSIGLSQTLLNKDHEEEYYTGCPAGPNSEVLRRHGDTIARLPNGFYRAQGRSDDTMNLSGIKVSSLELERILDTHDEVYESAAVAVQPEGEGAEALVVFAVLTGETDRASLLNELQTLIGKRLNPLFRIHDLITVESLPRTASNKMMRRELREKYSA